MKNTYSLKLNRDFRRLYSKGKSCAGGYVVVYCKKNRYKNNRIGLTASKSIGKAVTRNRMKRLMRESYRLLEDRLPKGYDFVVVARGKAVGKGQRQIQNDMEYALNKLGLLEK